MKCRHGIPWMRRTCVPTVTSSQTHSLNVNSLKMWLNSIWRKGLLVQYSSIRGSMQKSNKSNYKLFVVTSRHRYEVPFNSSSLINIITEVSYNPRKIPRNLGFCLSLSTFEADLFLIHAVTFKSYSIYLHVCECIDLLVDLYISTRKA